MSPNPSGGKTGPGRKLELLDLDALVEPVGQIRKNGKVFKVMPIDGVGQELFAQLVDRHTAGEKIPVTEQAQIGDKILVQVLPEADEEDRKRLTMEEKLKVISMAATAVERVRAFIREAMGGNAQRPAPKGRASARSR